MPLISIDSKCRPVVSWIQLTWLVLLVFEIGLSLAMVIVIVAMVVIGVMVELLSPSFHDEQLHPNQSDADFQLLASDQCHWPLDLSNWNNVNLRTKRNKICQLIRTIDI